MEGIRTMKTVLILATLAVALSASPVAAACIMSYCRDKAATMPAPGEQRAITNPSRQKVGSIYNPGGNRRIQIRDSHRRILGYIERDGTITNPSRQKVGKIAD